MRQIRLVPSGCQSWNTKVISATEEYFAYCSTLAVYIYRLSDFMLVKLIAAHERTITGFCWNPHDPNVFATTSRDGLVCIWDINREEKTHTFTPSSTPLGLDWSYHNSNHIALYLDNGSVRIWDFETNTCRESFSRSNSIARVLRWNPNEAGIFATGSADGTITITNTTDNKHNRIPSPEKNMEVIDIQWDLLSNTYLLAAYKNGSIILWDVESQTPLNAFDRKGAGVKAISWMSWAPGSFVSVSSRTGVIRVWNVSQKQPIEVIKAGKSGFHNLIFIPQSHRALCTFVDGSVGVFNLTSREMEFSTPPGHNETIFDVSYCPTEPHTLATSSYDSTVKIWNTYTMEMKQSLVGQEGVLYSISWSPSGHQIASSSSKGEVFIWDVARGTVLHKLSIHTHAVYRVDWNKLDSTMLASSSGDSTLAIIKDGAVFKRYRNPAALYGCMWSPHNKKLVATGCHDCSVRIFNTSEATTSPFKILIGHGGRVFHAIWSPLLPDIIASGSDDKTIRIWNIRDESFTILRGHTNFVRALQWSPEIPYLLLSGSWDATIRVWDTRSSACLKVVYDHYADVYGLDCHPERPFVFASSSRDTSLRFWVLDEVATAIRIEALITTNMSSLLATPESQMDLTSTPRLCGSGSRLLVDKVQFASPVEKFSVLTQFFLNADGIDNMWELIQTCIDGTPTSTNIVIQHYSTVVSSFKARAHDLEASRSRRSTIGGMKREEALVLAADVHLRLGQLERYCEVMVSLGEWLKALAVAPGVSLEYWKALSERYVERLVEQESADAVPFMVAGRQIDQLTDFLITRGQLTDAFAVCVADAEGAFPSVPVPNPEFNPPQTSVAPTERAKRLCTLMAKRYFNAAQPVMAACCYLAVNESKKAMRMLVKGHEIELAFALAVVLDIPRDHVIEVLAKKCERLNNWNLALDVLKNVSSPERKTLLTRMLCARYISSDADRFYHTAGFQSRDYSKDMAEQDLRENRTLEAIGQLVLARDFDRAIEIALAKLDELFGEDTWDMEQIIKASEPLHSIPLEVIPESRRSHILALINVIAGIQANWFQYRAIAAKFFENARSLISSRAVSFPISIRLLEILELRALSWTNKKGSKAKLEALLNSVKVEGNSKVQTAIEQTLAQIDNQEQEISTNEIIVAASNLPTGCNLIRTATSLITQRQIYGPEFVLEDNTSAMTLSEAIMWFSLNPFSPLNTGVRLNPF